MPTGANNNNDDDDDDDDDDECLIQKKTFSGQKNKLRTRTKKEI